MEELQRIIEKTRVDIQEGKPEDEILEFLVSVCGGNRQREEKLAELLGTIPQEKTARLLHRMLEIWKDKKVRKMINRSLYRLKSRGVAVEEGFQERGRSILRPLQEEPKKGFASGIDPSGQRLLLLVVPHPGRMWTVMQGVISDTQGLIDFSGGEMTRKGFKALFEEIRGKTSFPFVEMDPSCVGYQLVSAYRLTLKRGGAPPQDYLRLKKEIEDIGREYDRPLIYHYLREEEIVGDEWTLKKSGNLLKGDPYSTWEIDAKEVQPYAEAVLEAEASRLVLNPAQKDARFQEIYLKALFEIFTEEKRLLYQKRLEEMAYVLFKLQKQEEARISVAAAIDLKEPLNPIQPNPFLFQLVVKSILSLLAEEHQKKEKDTSLIVKP